MGVLGKDIFDLSRPRTSTRVRFGEEGYWVEDVPEMQAYGSILTEILNLDLASFQAAVGAVDQVIEKRDSDAAPRAWVQKKCLPPWGEALSGVCVAAGVSS